MYNEILQHHGILGMKWGVRRFQNYDGTLTAKGKARFDKVASSKWKQNSDTRSATRMLKRRAKETARLSNIHQKRSDKLMAEADANLKRKGLFENRADSDRRQIKGMQNLQLAEKSSTMAKEYKDASELAKKKLSDIESGKLKAGKDFIVQRDFNFHLSNFETGRDLGTSRASSDINQIQYLNGFGTSERRIIEKKRK